MINVVGVLEEECGDAKASLDLHDWEERDLTLTDGFEALHRRPDLALLLVIVRQSPQSLRHCFHFFLSTSAGQLTGDAHGEEVFLLGFRLCHGARESALFLASEKCFDCRQTEGPGSFFI